MRGEHKPWVRWVAIIVCVAMVVTSLLVVGFIL